LNSCHIYAIFHYYAIIIDRRPPPLAISWPYFCFLSLKDTPPLRQHFQPPLPTFAASAAIDATPHYADTLFDAADASLMFSAADVAFIAIISPLTPAIAFACFRHSWTASDITPPAYCHIRHYAELPFVIRQLMPFLYAIIY
jgi:hypothetical protein